MREITEPVGPAVRVHHEDNGRTLVLEDTFEPKGKQAEFFEVCERDDVNEILFHGAIRGGKSQACLKKIVAWAMAYPGKYLVSRATYKELNDSTKVTMLEGEGGLPPCLPPQLIRRDSTGRPMRYDSIDRNEVWLISGSVIRFRSLEPKERGKIRNTTYSAGFIDQVEEFDEEGADDFYQELLGRLSDPGGPGKMLLAANPGPEDHWVCRRFGASESVQSQRQPGTAHVHVSILDNADQLHPRYVERLLATKDTAPDYYNRMVLGLWGMFGGRRFKAWNPSISVVPRCIDIPSEWEILEGADYGWANPTHWTWVAIDHDGRLWVVAEYRASETTTKTHAEAIKRIRVNDDGYLGFRGALEPTVTWADPSFHHKRSEHQSIADEFADEGIYLAKAQNERVAGWDRLEKHLTEVMPDGYTRLRFFPTIEHVPFEIRNARIKPGTDDIEKVNDHGIDTIRYILNSRAPAPLEKTNAEEHSRSSVARRIVDRHKRPRTLVYGEE